MTQIFLLSFLTLLPIIGLVLAGYVLNALALYTMAKSRGINHPWLAWVPYANVWIVGSLSDQYHYVVRREIKNRRTVLLTLEILTLLFSGVVRSLTVSLSRGVMQSMMFHSLNPYIMTSTAVSIIGIVCGVASAAVGIFLMVQKYLALYDIYTSCEPDNAVLYLVVSIIFGFLKPLFLFLCRTKEEGMPPRMQAEEPVVGVEV